MKQVSRRSFIKHAGGAGMALWLGLSSKGNTLHIATGDPGVKFTPFIRVDPGGGITLFNIKPEMGQGTFQSIPALIAEEFEVSLHQVTIQQTNGEKEFGPGQRAGGSSSIRSNYTNFRKLGAAAREVFIIAASQHWGVDAATCYAENGTVIHQPTGRVLKYNELVTTASKIELPKNPSLKDPKNFKILGKSMPRPDVPLKTNGAAVFGIDVQVPGMLYATVQRCPVIGGTLKSF